MEAILEYSVATVLKSQTLKKIYYQKSKPLHISLDGLVLSRLTIVHLRNSHCSRPRIIILLKNVLGIALHSFCKTLNSSSVLQGYISCDRKIFLKRTQGCSIGLRYVLRAGQLMLSIELVSKNVRQI